jgi:hypothetical protein
MRQDSILSHPHFFPSSPHLLGDAMRPAEIVQCIPAQSADGGFLRSPAGFKYATLRMPLEIFIRFLV